MTQRIVVGTAPDTIIIHVDVAADGRRLGGTVTSSLHDDTEGPDEPWNVAVDAIESLVLAHAVAGVDVQSQAYSDGLATTLEALANYLT